MLRQLVRTNAMSVGAMSQSYTSTVVCTRDRDSIGTEVQAVSLSPCVSYPDISTLDSFA